MRRETDGAPDGARGAAPPPRQNSTVAAGGLRRALRTIIRRLIGAPDYEVYLEHCRSAGHAPRLTEREYVQEFFENKGKAPRCC
jgi:uncharacterized short protein YbdD (DUF466 family)